MRGRKKVGRYTSRSIALREGLLKKKKTEGRKKRIRAPPIGAERWKIFGSGPGKSTSGIRTAVKGETSPAGGSAIPRTSTGAELRTKEGGGVAKYHPPLHKYIGGAGSRLPGTQESDPRSSYSSCPSRTKKRGKLAEEIEKKKKETG